MRNLARITAVALLVLGASAGFVRDAMADTYCGIPPGQSESGSIMGNTATLTFTAPTPADGTHVTTPTVTIAGTVTVTNKGIFKYAANGATPTCTILPDPPSPLPAPLPSYVDYGTIRKSVTILVGSDGFTCYGQNKTFPCTAISDTKETFIATVPLQPGRNIIDVFSQHGYIKTITDACTTRTLTFGTTCLLGTKTTTTYFGTTTPKIPIATSEKIITVYYDADKFPTGTIQGSSCSEVIGTASDQDYTGADQVNVYEGAALLTTLTANQPQPNWVFTIPPAFKTGVDHILSFQAVNLNSSGAVSGLPVQIGTKTINCPPPPTLNLSAAPNPVDWGTTSIVSWTSPFANTCLASDGVGDAGWSGPKATNSSYTTVSLTAAKKYTLTCANTSNEVVTKSVIVDVKAAPPPIVSLTADGSSTANVAFGGSSMLAWSSASVVSCSTTGWTGAVPNIPGTKTTGALTAPATYSMTCTNAAGVSMSKTVNVTVAAPPTVTLTANPKRVANGGSSNLTWSAPNADSCTASGDWIGAGPRGTSNPFGGESTGGLTGPDKIYTLKCYNSAGVEAIGTANVTVDAPPPIVTSVTIDRPLNYCTAGANALWIVKWTSDIPAGQQTAWQLEILDANSALFKTSAGSDINTRSTGFVMPMDGKQYSARIKVRNAIGTESDWSAWVPFITPPNAYPVVKFSSNPAVPIAGSEMKFTDNTNYGTSTVTERQWNFGDGYSTIEKPAGTTGIMPHTYNADAKNLTITLSVNTTSMLAGEFCSSTSTGFTVQKRIPQFKEVRPGQSSPTPTP